MTKINGKEVIVEVVDVWPSIRGVQVRATVTEGERIVTV
jgi:hypothetical protein